MEDQLRVTQEQGWLREYICHPDTRIIWRRSAEQMMASAQLDWPDLFYVLRHSDHAIPERGIVEQQIRVVGRTLDNRSVSVVLVIFQREQTVKIILIE